MERPALNAIDLQEALTPILTGVANGSCFVTMSIGQWDELLQVSYDHNWILLEVDDDEKPVKAYKKPKPRQQEDKHED